MTEQVCRTVQEEDCSDPESPEPKRECSVVMEQECEEVVEVLTNQNTALHSIRPCIDQSQEVCRMETKMDCQMEEREACTTLRERY